MITSWEVRKKARITIHYLEIFEKTDNHARSYNAMNDDDQNNKRLSLGSTYQVYPNTQEEALTT